MRFEICTDEYERLGDTTQYGTIPLKGKKHNRHFFLDVTAADLLDLKDGTYDFDEEFKDLDSTQKNEIFDGLRVLAAFGGAKIIKEEDKDPEGFKFRVAGEKDYKEAAAFITDEDTLILGSVVKDGDIVNEDNLRATQFNNKEYVFLCRKSGKVVSVLVAVMPGEAAVTTAFQISGIAISKALSDKEKDEVVKGLWNYTKKAFEGEFRICRHLSYKEDDGFLPYAKEFGFVRTACLEKESAAGGNVEVYDKKL